MPTVALAQPAPIPEPVPFSCWPWVLPCAVMLAACLAASAVQAQTRFEGVRLVVGRHGLTMVKNPGLNHVEGTLTIDAQAGRLLFEAPGEPSREIAIVAIDALHYEESSFPRRIFGRRTPYVAVHYTNASGEPDFAVFRLPGESSAEILASLESATGQAVDRTETTTSFAGLPIHAGVGDLVYVTDQNGQRTKGRVTGVNLSSIDLAPGGSFEAAAVRQVDVGDPIWGGVLAGAGLGFLAGALVTANCSNSCTSSGFLSPGGWGMVALGGLTGGLVDAATKRHAYRRPAGSRSLSVEWSPQLSGDAKGLWVTFRF